MVLNYKDIAMGTNSNEEINNSLENIRGKFYKANMLYKLIYIKI